MNPLESPPITSASCPIQTSADVRCIPSQQCLASRYSHVRWWFVSLLAVAISPVLSRVAPAAEPEVQKPRAAAVKAAPKPKVVPSKQEVPADILDPAAWSIGAGKTGTLELSKLDGHSVMSVAGLPVTFIGTTVQSAGKQITMRLRLPTDSAKPTSVTLTAGLKDSADLKDKGLYVTLAGQGDNIRWTVFDPKTIEARTPTVSGYYRPHFAVERSLSWPESLRRIIESDMVTSTPLTERWLTLKLVLRENGYEVSLDGIPLAHPKKEGLDTKGYLRLTLSPGTQVAAVQIEKAAPVDAAQMYLPVSIESILNASRIDGQEIDHGSFAKDGRIVVGGVPFAPVRPDAKGNAHVDVGASWFRQGGLDGRYSGSGKDAMSGRWVGALMKDPARLTVRLPMARYRALHLLAASDSETDSVPVVTAQFYRAQSGFPKNFTTRVPSFRATSSKAEALPVKTRDGGKGTLYLVTIPIDPGALAEFDDLDFVELELTKQVQIYRASPDPLFYSQHQAGLPSSVHIYALTAERPAVEVSLAADAASHIWTAPATSNYSVTLRNRSGAARQLQVELATTSLDGRSVTSQKRSVALPSDKPVTLSLALKLASYGHHDVRLTVLDGSHTWNETRSLAYLHEDTRSRGDWDFGRGPLFGFYNWGGAHNTPRAEQQLLVMAKAGIESTPGSFEQYVSRHGEKTQKVMEDYKIFTMKFAGGGDHYITARFSDNLKKEGLEKARAIFLADLEKAQSKAGPHSRPIFLSFFPEPALGPITHGLWPDYYGEPEYQLSPGENDRYQSFLNGFVEGAKIVKENYPSVKCLLPHGDPMFAAHFLRGSAEVRKLIDGVTVDIPFFERLPEQQIHQVALHRLYMVRNEFAKAGIPNPLLPMYEGPCVPSGPGALTDQEHADLSIRDSLMLMVYGVNIQNGGFPAYDTASYWGEQHYGFGVLNRVSLETPKPAYAALATLTRHLNRANYNKWVPTGSLTTFALQYKHYRTGKLVHVMWTLRGKRPVTLEVKDGAKVSAFDQMDNEHKLVAKNGKVTFTLDQSPCYVEGLTEDAVIALGEPDHSDSKPSANSAKLANFGDGTWQVSSQRELGYEGSHTPYVVRVQNKMTVAPVEAPPAQGGKALAVHLEKPEKERVVVPYYSVVTPAQPVVIAGKASHLGLWVKGASDWGRVVYFLRDAKGEQWISVGARGAWNCDDIHSWSSFNFDGWRYLRFELPSNSPYDAYREAGSTWWGAYSRGDSIVDLPLKLEKIVVERRTHVLYVNDPQPAKADDVLLGDLIVEYATPEDATPDAVRLAALRMPLPAEVKGLGNPIQQMLAEGVAAPVTIQQITLPEQEADGTRCFVHFDPVVGAKQYDIWASLYPDGTGALRVGKDWKAPGLQIRGLRPNQDFYLFAAYTNADGSKSKPSAPFKVNLEDFFAMK